ncbi:hypothetical protein RCL1_007905 [Eukaryota sp. TZLM3-RCL]
MLSPPSLKKRRYHECDFLPLTSPLQFPHLLLYHSLRFVLARVVQDRNPREVCFLKGQTSICSIFKFLVMFGNVSSSFRDVVIEVVQHYLTEERPFFNTSHHWSQLKLLHSLFPNNCFALDINLENESLDSFAEFRICSLTVDYLKPGLFESINCCSLVHFQCQYDENCVFFELLEDKVPSLEAVTIDHWNLCDGKVDLGCSLPQLKYLSIEITDDFRYCDVGGFPHLEQLIVGQDNDYAHLFGQDRLSKLKFVDFSCVQTPDGFHKEARLHTFKARYLSSEVLTTLLQNRGNFESNCKVYIETRDELFSIHPWVMTDHLVTLNVSQSDSSRVVGNNWCVVEEISVTGVDSLTVELFDLFKLKSLVLSSTSKNLKSTVTLNSPLHLSQLYLSCVDAATVYKCLEKCLCLLDLSLANVYDFSGTVYPTGSLSNLRCLSFSKFSKELISTLPLVPKLKKISLSEPLFSDIDCNVLSCYKFPRLQEIDLVGDVALINYQNVATSVMSVSLNFIENLLVDGALEWLKTLPKLQNLSIFAENSESCEFSLPFSLRIMYTDVHASLLKKTLVTLPRLRFFFKRQRWSKFSSEYLQEKEQLKELQSLLPHVFVSLKR